MGAPLDATHPGTRSALDAAMAAYLRGDAIDMTDLADTLDVGRATLYRWVGSREQLVVAVLSEATVRTFDAARKAAEGDGIDLVIDACTRFMHGILAAEPLRAFTAREPLLFVRLATTPGMIEQSAAHGIADLLREQAGRGELTLKAPPEVLAIAIVRVCDSHVYAHLLGPVAPDIDTAVTLIRLLLD